jgi:hypothetical protein
MFDIRSGLVRLKEIATPSTPGSGLALFYPKSDHKIYGLGSDGVERQLDNTLVFWFQYQGQLVVKTGVAGLPIPFACTLETIVARVNSAPAGASDIFDINYDGTTIFSTQANRPTIAIGSNFPTVGAASTVNFAAGSHWLSLDIDQIGSTPGSVGADLVLGVVVRRTG